MRKYATFDLILHDGKAPPWLVTRMKKLGKPIIEVIVDEFGRRELLRRLADPMWFQALAYVLGYDWNSSGVTTVLTGVLREILNPDLGILVAGGKGKKSLQAPDDLRQIGEIFGFSESKIKELIRASRLAAKADNAVLQDEHTIYHHAVFVSKDGEWAIVQQGMNVVKRTARRYHWVSEGLKSFVVEPHSGIIGDMKLPFALDMTSRESEEARKIAVDLVAEGVQRVKSDWAKIERMRLGVASLDSFLFGKREEPEIKLKIIPGIKVNWKALAKAYEISPKSYEELIEIRGIGPGTIRALALIAELIYDAEVCWRDPLRYTFAVGGKDRVPYPVNVKRMEKVAEVLEKAIEEARLGKREKLEALKRLSKIVPRDVESYVRS